MKEETKERVKDAWYKHWIYKLIVYIRRFGK